MNIDKILILSDFSEVFTSLVKYGLSVARNLQASLWVQHVYYVPPNVAGEVYIPNAWTGTKKVFMMHLMS